MPGFASAQVYPGHFVDEKMDHGPILIQAAVPALPDDDEGTLGARILELEHRIYPQAL